MILRPLWALSLISFCLSSVGFGAELEQSTREGMRAYEAGDLAAALVQWSLALSEAKEEGDMEAQFDLLLRLASIQRQLGRVQQSQDILDRAQDLARKEGLESRGALACARGLLELARGRAHRAQKLLEQCFELLQREEHPAEAASAALGVGLARSIQGDRKGASRAYDGAVRLFSALGDQGGRAQALSNLGAVERRTGLLLAARTHLELAVDAARASGHVGVEIDAISNLALVLQDLGMDSQSLALLNDALASARARRDLHRQGTLLLNRGAILHRQGNLEDAKKNYQAAATALDEAHDPPGALQARLNATLIAPSAEPLRRLAKEARGLHASSTESLALLHLYRNLGKASPEGRKALDRASKLAEELQSPDLLWPTLFEQGTLSLDEGEGKHAIALLSRAVDTLEWTRRSMADQGLTLDTAPYTDLYQTLINALVQEGEHGRALGYAERMQRVDAGPPPATDSSLGKELDQLQAQSDWVDEKLAAAKDPEALAALREEQAELRIAFADAVDQMRAANPDLDRLTHIAPEDLEAVAGRLGPGVLVLQPVALPDRLVLLLLGQSIMKAVEVPVAASEIESAIRRLSRVLNSGRPFKRTGVDKLADQMGTWLLDPIKEELSQASVLVVSSSGLFRQVPFAALRMDGAYLAELLPVVAITHVGSINTGTTAPRFHLNGEDLLLVGNPDGSLPGAEKEVEAILDRFPQAQLLLGGQATRATVVQSAEHRIVLHLATHGVLDPDHPDRSYLVLGGQHGRLAYREIPGLAPFLEDTRLVVLSACESGLPLEARQDPERQDPGISINGMAAQFRRAGVETLLATLWKVDDEGTLLFMDAFYGSLQRGADLAHALQSAQQTLIEQPQWSHPWFWGAFVLVGDWR